MGKGDRLLFDPELALSEIKERVPQQAIITHLQGTQNGDHKVLNLHV